MAIRGILVHRPRWRDRLVSGYRLSPRTASALIVFFAAAILGQRTAAADAPKPVVGNERVTVWKIGGTDAARPPSMKGEAIEISVGPSLGAVVLRRNGDGRQTPPSTVIVELKDHPVVPLVNTSGYPNAFPRPRVRKVMETDRVIVWDYSWTPGEPTPMHFHDKDVVVVYLADGALRSTTPDGQITVNDYTAGTVRFNARDRVHTEELATGSQRAIIVELK